MKCNTILDFIRSTSLFLFAFIPFLGLILDYPKTQIFGYQSHHYWSAKENLVKGRIASITLLVLFKKTRTLFFFSILDSSPAKVHKPLHDRPLSVSSTKSSQIRSFSPFRATIRSSQNSGGGVYGSVIYHNRPPQTRLRCGKYYVAFNFLVKLTLN